MKQLVQSARSGALSVRTVPPHRVSSGHLLVRTNASLISAGTERMVVDFAKKNLIAKARSRPDLVQKVLSKVQRDGVMATLESVLARLDEPLPLGYSAAGTVVAVGAGLEGRFRVRDRVAMAGAGLANHADENLVPANLVAPIPADVTDEEACFGTVSSIALNGVRLLRPQLGDLVAVIGVGLVGQLATQLLRLHGCRPICLDYDASKLALAQSCGADMVWNLANGNPSEAVLSHSNGIGCDGVLIAAATDSNEPFETAADIARDRARVSLVGITGTEFPYREFMKKELSVMVSRSYGPGRYDEDYEKRNVKYPVGWVRWTETENLAECVRLMSPSNKARLETGVLITHRFDFADVENAYKLVTEQVEPHLGVVLRYPQVDAVAAAGVKLGFRARPEAAAGKCVLGVIGAGSFARTKLLPALKGDPLVVLHTIATRRGISADDSQRKFGFANSTTDEASIFDNPEINAVLIATPHSSHAALTVRALTANKSVMVEKPLALNRDELSQVVKAREASSGFFQIGFNRRFAPMIVKTRDHFRQITGPKTMLLRVNAGQLPPESWQKDAEEGGGRILGEVCHFIDLARFVIGSPIVAVHADAARPSRGPAEDLTVTMRFGDGSLATIMYTAIGDTSYSKERFECYGGGSVVAVDNFRTLEIAIGGRIRRQKARIVQDKGHKAEMAAFVRAVAEQGPAPVCEDELIETSLATIAVLESLSNDTSIAL
jgi:predicted dehydrogenase/threonine dehydrogenase-like Zn-dependent dehydrogenase